MTMTIDPKANEGLFTRWVTVGTAFADLSVENGFGLVRDIHREVSNALTATIVFAETTQAAGFGAARRIHERWNAVFVGGLDAGEEAFRAAVSTVRVTSLGATRFVSDAAGAITTPSRDRAVTN